VPGRERLSTMEREKRPNGPLFVYIYLGTTRSNGSVETGERPQPGRDSTGGPFIRLLREDPLD